MVQFVDIIELMLSVYVTVDESHRSLEKAGCFPALSFVHELKQARTVPVSKRKNNDFLQLYIFIITVRKSYCNSILFVVIFSPILVLTKYNPLFNP